MALQLEMKIFLKMVLQLEPETKILKWRKPVCVRPILYTSSRTRPRLLLFADP